MSEADVVEYHWSETNGKKYRRGSRQFKKADVGIEPTPAAKTPDVPWKWEEDGMTVIRGTARSAPGCHNVCGILSYVKDAAGDAWSYDLGENWPNEVGQGAKGTSGVISTVQQADGTIGYADASQAGDLGTVAVKVGDDYVPFSAEAAAKVVDASPLDDSAKGDNRVVVKLDHNTTEKGAYPIVLVSYDVACPAYKDANTAKFVKSWLTYVTSDEGQQTAASAAGSAPMSNTLRQKVVKSIDAIKTK